MGMERMTPQRALSQGQRLGVPRRRRARSGGQVMVEYALLLAFVFMAFFGVMAFFLDHVGDYYMNIIKIVALPFP